MADARPDLAWLKDQIRLAEVMTRDFTGCGVYTRLSVPDEAPLPNGDFDQFEQMPKAHGVHPDLPAGAGFILWLKDGRIACLESYTFEGDWPTSEDQFAIHT